MNKKISIVFLSMLVMVAVINITNIGLIKINGINQKDSKSAITFAQQFRNPKTAQIIADHFSRDVNSVIDDSLIIDTKSIMLNNLDLEDIDGITIFKNLELLDVYGNKITHLPKDIGDLSELEVLYAYGNKLEAIPDSIGDLSKLSFLQLSSNDFTSIPDSIGKLASLEYFNMYSTKLNKLPDSIGNLSNLTDLNVMDTNIKVIPDSITKLSNLKSLYASSANISKIPNDWSNLTNLTYLYLDNNHVMNIPQSLLELPNLIMVSLSWQTLEMNNILWQTNLTIDNPIVLPSGDDFTYFNLSDSGKLNNNQLSWTNLDRNKNNFTGNFMAEIQFKNSNVIYSGDIVVNTKLPIDISTLEISNVANEVYTSNEIKPKVTITNGNDLLVENVDYYLTYQDNTNVGEASISIFGINDYEGTQVINFKIEKATPIMIEPFKVDPISSPTVLNSVNVNLGRFVFYDENKNEIEISGTLKWENEMDIISSSQIQKASFIPDNINIESVLFDLNIEYVKNDTEIPGDDNNEKEIKNNGGNETKDSKNSINIKTKSDENFKMINKVPVTGSYSLITILVFSISGVLGIVLYRKKLNK